MVSKILSKDQKQNRVKFCKNVLEKIIDDPDIFRQIITRDETWVFKYDHETKRQSMQWKTAEPPRPKKACDTSNKIVTKATTNTMLHKSLKHKNGMTYVKEIATQ